MLGWAKAVVHKHRNKAREKNRRYFMVFLHKVSADCRYYDKSPFILDTCLKHAGVTSTNVIAAWF